MSDDGARIYLQQSVTLDSNGAGIIRFAVLGSEWKIDYARVSVTTHVNQAVCTVYQNFIGASYQVDATSSGSSGDTSDTVIELSDGDCLLYAWTGGDPGAIATAVLRGWSTIPHRGFRTV